MSKRTKCKHKHKRRAHADACRARLFHCVCSLALFHPSRHDSQSLRIRATSTSTEKSMVKYINKNTIKPIGWRGRQQVVCGGDASSQQRVLMSCSALALKGGFGGVRFPLLVPHQSPHSFSYNVCTIAEKCACSLFFLFLPEHNDLILPNCFVLSRLETFSSLKQKHSPVSHHRSSCRSQMHSWTLRASSSNDSEALPDHE